MSCPRQEPSIINLPLLTVLQPLLMANLHLLMALLYLQLLMANLHLLEGMAILHLHLLEAMANLHLQLLMANLHLLEAMDILHLLPPVMATPPVTRCMAQVWSSPIRVTQASVIWTMWRRLRRSVCPASRLTVTRRVCRGAR